jgi:hypothetical protein
MKAKLSILIILILFFAMGGHAQTVTDSVRTRNDKPGTPQSLRTADQSPQSHVTIINNNGPQVNNAGGQATITTNNADNNTVPKTPVTLQSIPVNRTDTAAKPALPKVSNASNPIRN